MKLGQVFQVSSLHWDRNYRVWHHLCEMHCSKLVRKLYLRVTIMTHLRMDWSHVHTKKQSQDNLIDSEWTGSTFILQKQSQDNLINSEYTGPMPIPQKQSQDYLIDSEWTGPMQKQSQHNLINSEWTGPMFIPQKQSQDNLPVSEWPSPMPIHISILGL